MKLKEKLAQEYFESYATTAVDTAFIAGFEKAREMCAEMAYPWLDYESCVDELKTLGEEDVL